VLIATLAVGVLGWLTFAYSNAWSAGGFDPAGRNVAPWANATGPGNAGLHVVQRYYQWTGTSPSTTNRMWLTQERWVVTDGGGKAITIATETNDANGSLVRSTYADAATGVGVARNWIALDQPPQRQATTGACEFDDPDGFLYGASPQRPDVESMMASGYTSVSPDASPVLKSTVLEKSPSLLSDVDQSLRFSDEGYDHRVEASFMKLRSYYLDGDGFIIAYRGATIENGALVSERVELSQISNASDALSHIHHIRDTITATCEVGIQ
jgi:hypothetical protein